MLGSTAYWLLVKRYVDPKHSVRPRSFVFWYSKPCGDEKVNNFATFWTLSLARCIACYLGLLTPVQQCGNHA